MEKQRGIRARLRAVVDVARWVLAIGPSLDGVLPPEEPEVPEVVQLRRSLVEARREIDAMREANEQIAADLLAEGGRRRELEVLLEAQPFAETARWADALEAWRLRLLEGKDVRPDEFASLVSLCGQLVERATVLYNALNRDRTGLAAALVEIQRTAAGYFWVTEGRGPYAWDDNRYREETGHALNAILATAGAALRVSGDRATAAIRDGVVLDEKTPLPLETVVAGLLIDEVRLRAMLEQRWAEVRIGPDDAIAHWPAFVHVDPHSLGAFLRAARAVLSGAQAMASQGLAPEAGT